MSLSEYHGIEIKPLEDVDAPKYKQVPLAKLGVLPRHPFRMALIAPSHGGKSVLMSNLLTKAELYGNYFKKENVIVISPTAVGIDGIALDSTYIRCGVPSGNIYHPDNAAAVIKRVFDIKREEKKKQKRKTLVPVLIVFDDIVHDRQLLRSTKEIEQVYTAGRHYGISSTFLTQYWFGCPKQIRLQMTFIAIFQCRRQDIDQFAEDYAPPGVDHRTFIAEVENLLSSQPHAFITVNLQVAMHKRYRLLFNDPPLRFDKKGASDRTSNKRSRDVFEVRHKLDERSASTEPAFHGPWSSQAFKADGSKSIAGNKEWTGNRPSEGRAERIESRPSGWQNGARKAFNSLEEK